MNLEDILNKVVFELFDFEKDYETFNYDGHNIYVEQIPEDRNMEYNIPICESLLKITVDSTSYLVTVATRLYCLEEDEVWRRY